MRKCMWLVVLVAALAAPSFAQETLFNGKDLTNWQFVPGGRQGFTVENGIMHSTGVKGIIVYTGRKIGDGTLHVVYNMSNEKGNSGVFIRIPELPKTEDYAINHGIEVQIDDRDNDYHCTGVLYSWTKAMARPEHPAPAWNTMDITMDGPRTIVKVNGVLVTDYDGHSPVPPKAQPWEPDRGPRPDTGYFALQAHDNSAVISFKEVVWEPGKK